MSKISEDDLMLGVTRFKFRLTSYKLRVLLALDYFVFSMVEFL